MATDNLPPPLSPSGIIIGAAVLKTTGLFPCPSELQIKTAQEKT